MMMLVFVILVLAALATTVHASNVIEGKLIVKLIFKSLGITDVDVDQCIGDVSGFELKATQFQQEVKSKDYKMAVSSLSSAISYLSSSVGDCGVKEINLKFDSLAIALKFAKLTAAVDGAVDVVVGLSHVEKDIEAIATAIANEDSDALAQGINSLLSDWSQVAGGCSADAKGCNFISGLLRIIQEVAQDVKPCEAAIEAVVATFETGATQFEAKNYQDAVASFASALDQLSKALMDETCGLKRVGDLIGKLSPKLASAVVQVEESNGVKIVIGSADVYDASYRAVKALKQGDYQTFGSECGALLRILRSSGCSTQACAILEGVLASLQLELSNFDACITSADQVWGDVEQSVQLFDERQPVAATKSLANIFVALANTLNACQIPELASIAETMLNKMGDTTAAAEIGDVITVLVNGADVTLEIQQAVTDFKSKNYHSFGGDLSTLASAIGSSRCHSVGCQIVQGLLEAAGVAFADLEQCEADIKSAEMGFVTGAQQFSLKQYKLGVSSFSSSLNTVARAVGDCGLSQELDFIIQEANVLGLANITQSWGADMNILVHGADFYQLVYQTVQDAKTHNWRAAGSDMHAIVSQLSQWTNKHACSSNFCYVVIGMIQYLGDIQGSIKECEADFKGAWADFSSAASNFSDHKSAWHWSHNKDAVKAGVKSLGEGVQLVAKGVQDCEIAEFADILARLAAKLGIAPEISWLEDILHVLINGVKIEDEVGKAMVDWSDRNWPAFGYEVVSLVKTLL